MAAFMTLPSIALAFFPLYWVFFRRARDIHLSAGALIGSALWYLMGPLFHAFLAYNPGYGLAFGSFKSLIVVIIWIYYSFAVFLLGAETAAALERREIIFLKRLIHGKNGLPAAVTEKFIARYGPGETIFAEGDAGDQMYAVLKGSVAIWKGGRMIATVNAAQYFGVVSFLLDSPRIATAVALDDVDLHCYLGCQSQEVVAGER